MTAGIPSFWSYLDAANAAELLRLAGEAIADLLREQAGAAAAGAVDTLPPHLAAASLTARRYPRAECGVRIRNLTEVRRDCTA